MNAVERRCSESPFAFPVDGTARVCASCGCVYLDYGPGHDAHVVVFGHAPAVGDE